MSDRIIDLGYSVKKLTFRIYLDYDCWRCCINGNLMCDTIAIIEVKPPNNKTLEFINFGNRVYEIYNKLVRGKRCVIAEELAYQIKKELEKEYPGFEITVKIVFTEPISKENKKSMIVWVEA